MSKIVIHPSQGYSDSILGTSITQESIATDIKTLGYQSLLLIIGNVDDTNHLTARVDGYAYDPTDGGLQDVILESTTVGDSDSLSLLVYNPPDGV